MTHRYSNIPLVLLSGVGRSGTMAVREALGRHPLIHSTGSENNIIYDLLDTAARNCTAPSRRFALQVDDETYDRKFRELILGLLWPQPRTSPPARLLAFSMLTPDRAGYACRLFPGLKIVFLVRNGIEAVSSRLRFERFAGTTFTSHCDVWRASLEVAEWGAGREDFALLRHEHLVEPQTRAATLAELWSFLGLAQEQACCDHLATALDHRTADPAAETAPGGSLRDRSDRWRDWTAVRRRVFADRCLDAMRYFGYEVPWASGEDTARMRDLSSLEASAI